MGTTLQFALEDLQNYQYVYMDADSLNRVHHRYGSWYPQLLASARRPNAI